MKPEEAGRLVDQFEKGILPKEQWTHEAHFIMAFWYFTKFPLPLAIEYIKNGIKKYNASIGGSNTDSAGYHETITVFYSVTVASYLLTAGITTLSGNNIRDFLQQPFLTKEYPLQFYSKEVLTGREARLAWVSPDKLPLAGDSAQ